MICFFCYFFVDIEWVVSSLGMKMWYNLKFFNKNVNDLNFWDFSGSVILRGIDWFWGVRSLKLKCLNFVFIVVSLFSYI